MEWLAYQTITAAYNYVPQGQAQGEQPNVKEAIGDSCKKGLGGLRGGFGRKRKQPEPQPEHRRFTGRPSVPLASARGPSLRSRATFRSSKQSSAVDSPSLTRMSKYGFASMPDARSNAAKS